MRDFRAHQVSIGHEERDRAEEEGDRVGGPDPRQDADVGADAHRDHQDGPGWVDIPIVT